MEESAAAEGTAEKPQKPHEINGRLLKCPRSWEKFHLDLFHILLALFPSAPSAAKWKPKEKGASLVLVLLDLFCLLVFFLTLALWNGIGWV